MIQEQKSYAVRIMKSYAGKAGIGLALFAIIVSLTMIAGIYQFGVWETIFAVFIGLIFVVIARFHRILFIIDMMANASYLEKHDMECWVLPIYSTKNSITNYLEKWRNREPDVGFFKYDGKSYKVRLYKMFSMPNNHNQALVFVDKNSGKVFGVPGVYMPDLEDMYKNKSYYAAENSKPKSGLNSMGDEEAVETVKPKKKSKLPIIITSVVLALCLGVGGFFCINAAMKNVVIFQNAEGKSEEDVAALKEMIIAQKKQEDRKEPLQINYDLNSDQYLWEDGRLIGLYWSGVSLQAPVDVSGLSQLTLLDLSQNSITDVYFKDNEELFAVDLSGNTLGSLTIGEECPNLKVLICEECYLYRGLSVYNCPALEELYCANSELEKLYLKDNPNLTVLDCSRNDINHLDLSNNPKLLGVDCSDNRLVKLDVSSNTQLVALGCSGNKLNELDVSANVSLEILGCASNKLTELDLSNNIHLTEVDVIYNENIVVTGAPEGAIVYQ